MNLRSFGLYAFTAQPPALSAINEDDSQVKIASSPQYMPYMKCWIVVEQRLTRPEYSGTAVRPVTSSGKFNIKQ